MYPSSKRLAILGVTIVFILTLVSDAGATFVITAEGHTQGQSYGALGQGFYIPDEDLLSSELTGRGVVLFNSLPKECIIETLVAVDRKDQSFYQSTKDLYSAISTDTNIELKLKGEFTMGASIRAVTNNLATSNSQITGNSLELYTQNIDYSVTKDCINNQRMSRKFLKDFQKLPKVIKTPWFKDSWLDYHIFLKKYGSHVVNSVLSGASIYQYAFASSDKHYSQRNFTVKACASLAGPMKIGNLSLSACSGITSDEISNIEKLKMVEKLVVRGGSAKTRAKLVNSRDIQTILDFLIEGTTDPSPILYKFMPLWDILQSRYIGTSLMAQARNLEEYYKGFLDYGCQFQTTANHYVLQKFVATPHSTPEFPSYMCRLGPTGCQEHDDCHYRDAFWCACGGESCIRYRDVELNSGEVKSEAYAYNPGTSYWGWQGCRRYGFKCYCTARSDTWQIVWQDDREHVLRNINRAVSRRFRRARNRIRELENQCPRK